MPIEIRQIGIRMQVGDGDRIVSDDAGLPRAAAIDDHDRAQIVRECTRAVLAALARQARR